MRLHGARREEVSLNFTLLETHSIDSLHGRHFFGLLDCKTCSRINCQECRKSTSQDWYLIRKYLCKLYVIFRSPCPFMELSLPEVDISYRKTDYTHRKSNRELEKCRRVVTTRYKWTNWREAEWMCCCCRNNWTRATRLAPSKC